MLYLYLGLKLIVPNKMPPKTAKISGYDEKVRLVIGDLMMRADTLSKTIITAYDPSKDRSINKNVLGGSRFQTAALDACALFLGIQVEDSNGRIYSNKPSLAICVLFFKSRHCFQQHVLNAGGILY